MATCAALSVADEALRATTENEHFQRLCRLLMRGGVTLLREVFDSKYPPANLPSTLNNPTIKAQLQKLRKDRVLSQPEWDCLYLPTGMHGKSADFDISLLFKLLRNICSLAPPATRWDNLPNSTDHSLEADLARIKYYRNFIYGHNQRMEIKYAVFAYLWTEISEALLRIASSLSSAKKDEWKESIDKLRHDPLTPDAQQYVAELRTWCKKDMETKDEVEKVNIKLEQMNIKQDQMNIKQDQQGEAINILLEQIIHIRTIVESSKPCGSSSCPSVCIPMVAGPSHAEFERAAGSSATSEIQQNQPPDLGIWQVILSFTFPFSQLIKYLKIKLGVYVQTSSLGSLVITVSCSSLQVLEGLWEDYCSGHLNEVIQETLVTAEVLKELNLSEVKLKTIISEEEYKACKELLTRKSAPQHQSAPQEPSGAATPGSSAAPQYQAPSPEAATPGPSATQHQSAPQEPSWAATPGPSAAPRQYQAPSPEAATPGPSGTASVSGEKLLEDLPYKSYQRVVMLLQPSSSGTDYKSLAAEMGYTSKQMRYLETADDPVSELIKQARGMKITELMSLLKDIGRDDVVEELRQYLEQVHHHGSSKDNADYTAESGYVLAIDDDINFPIKRKIFPLLDIFEDFGFTIQRHHTLTTSEMLMALTYTAKNDFSAYDCFVCVIQSHGSKDGICGTDTEMISLETITSLFSRDKCPSLDGKPKIFLIEAIQTDKKPHSGTFSFPVFPEEEVLIWYNLSPSRSWIRSVMFLAADVFNKLSTNKHLMEMMDRVNEDFVAFFKVQPWQISTLTKRVFFKSKSL